MADKKQQTVRPTLGELFELFGAGLPLPPTNQGEIPDEEWEDTKAAWVNNVGRILMTRYQMETRRNGAAGVGNDNEL